MPTSSLNNSSNANLSLNNSNINNQYSTANASSALSSEGYPRMNKRSRMASHLNETGIFFKFSC